MKCSGKRLFTPVYLKLTEAMPWPQEEKAFYLLTSDGLFLCRNTPFFRSCVPVEDFPSELAGQKPFLKLNYPRIPRRLMERVIGFFDVIGARHASEAAVLIAWNRTTDVVEVIVPNQVGVVGTSWYGHAYPLELEYEVPPLPPHLVLLGDIHSHVDGPAYASYTDKSDETHRPGLHIVIGRILDEPPQFHCEATADGFRFRISDLSLILEGYHRRRVSEVPAEWIDKVTVRPWTSKNWYGASDKTEKVSGGSNDSFRSAGSGQSMVPARRDEPEAKALTPENKIDGARASSPAAVWPTDLSLKDSIGPSAQPTTANDNNSAPRPPKASDESPAP